MTNPHPLADDGPSSTLDSGTFPPGTDSIHPGNDSTALNEAERHQLLEEWSHGGGNYPSKPTLHALFAAQAHAAPTQPACHYGETTLTYQQLDEQITRLAAYLQTLLGSDQL